MINEIKLKKGDKEFNFRLNECETMALAQAKNAVSREWEVDGQKDYRLNDDVGYEQTITTLTALETQVARQKNLEYSVEDAIDVVAGVGAWKEEGKYIRAFYNDGEDLDSWMVGHGKQNAAASQSEASMDMQSFQYMYLRKMISYTRVELEQAAASGVWNVIEEKSAARKRAYDLNFAKFAFQGKPTLGYDGLLSVTGAQTDISAITKKLMKMTDAEFQEFLTTSFPGYYVNVAYSTKPNVFLLPELDRIGLSSVYPTAGAGFTSGRNRLQLLEEAFRNFTGDAGSKVIGSNFANAQLNGGVDQYAMYRKDPFELKIENPIPYGVYPGVSVDGFNFQNTALSQISGVVCKYTQQMYYFKNETPDAQ